MHPMMMLTVAHVYTYASYVDVNCCACSYVCTLWQCQLLRMFIRMHPMVMLTVAHVHTYEPYGDVNCWACSYKYTLWQCQLLHMFIRVHPMVMSTVVHEITFEQGATLNCSKLAHVVYLCQHEYFEKEIHDWHPSKAGTLRPSGVARKKPVLKDLLFPLEKR